MDVVAGPEDLLQHLLVGDVGEHPQLDLAVVGREQAGALLGDEAGAHGAADLGPDRDVLQVRVGAREPPGRRRRLVEGRVDAARGGVDQVRQRVEVGVLELGQLAPGLDLLDDRVLVADLGEDPGVGREAGFAAALAGQPEILEEDCADLLRRADRELLPGQLVDLLFESVDPLAEAGADLGEALGVELQPLALHRRQHLDQRQLDLAQQRPQAELLDAGALELGEGRDQARLLGGLEPRLDLLAERELAVVLVAFSGRRALGEADPGVGGQLDQLVGAALGLEQVGGDHRVVLEAELDALARRGGEQAVAAAAEPLQVVTGDRLAGQRDGELVVGRRCR